MPSEQLLGVPNVQQQMSHLRLDGMMQVTCTAVKNLSTSVLGAALMGGKGTIWAFDRDATRLERLKANAQTVGATSIVAEQV